MKTKPKYFRRFLSLVLLIVFVFCTTATISASTSGYSKIKSVQKESKSKADNESFVFEEQDEDSDDDVNYLGHDFFYDFNVGVKFFHSFEVNKSNSYYSTELFTQVPIFISNRIIRI